MKKLTSFLIYFISCTLVPISTFSQCDTVPDLSAWFIDDPNTEGVGIFKKTGTGFEYAGVAFSNQTEVVEMNLDEVSKILFSTVCKISEITTAGGPNAIGTICSQDFECQEDAHFYSPPIEFDPYGSPVIHLTFSDTLPPFAPDINVDIFLTGCGITPPVLTMPQNNASNTGTTIQFSWTAIPNATEYDLQIIETCLGCPLYSFVVTGNTYSVTGLNPNSSYLWRVRARNAICEGAWSVSFFWTGPANPQGHMLCNFFEQGSFSSFDPIQCDVPITFPLGNVVLCSESSITLLPGFTVSVGARFIAKTNCD